MYKSQIIKIANILAINYQRIQSYGLINGILGVAIFYYHYSRYIGYDKYEKMANNLLDTVTSQKSKRMPHTFSSGLYGLGWSIKYLMKEKIIDADNDVIGMFDRMAFSKYSGIELEHDINDCYPLFSKGIYSSILCNKALQKQTFLATKYFFDNIDETVVKMPFLISILYFFQHYDMTSEETNMMASMKAQLIALIKKALISQSFQIKDLYVLEILLKRSGIDIKLPIRNYDTINDLYMNWQTIIYRDVVPSLNNVNFISLTEILERHNFYVYPNQLSLDGLCSLGINLIKKQEEESSCIK